ncbi:MAG: lipoprotein [Ilumatobacteraceae bacterium]|nr:lipoprotein [Ilumatobacteraceae bacterium]MCU1390186.1 lipoprotein [Ilumatobacteraceae bacterium]
MHHRGVVGLAAACLTVSVGACGHEQAISPGPSAVSVTTTGGVDPNAPEVVEPGDIPDNQVFVKFEFPGGLFSVKVPEGWARTESADAVTFTDKYNSITIEAHLGSTPPTVSNITASGLADVKVDPTFALVDVATASTRSGSAVRARYEIGSAPNPVTGKKALLAVERYVYYLDGTRAVLTLAGAKGADNVDPWKTVSDSLTWS